MLGISMMAACTGNPGTSKNKSSKADTISILQTADIHGQLSLHDELFWENETIVFKKLGGVAYIRSLFDSVKSKNPDGTLILDGGDLIQGSAVAALSEGKAFPPIVNAMGYDFLIPGNWEVVYGKEAMLEVLNGYNTPVIAANMYDEDTGAPLFPPYFTKEIHGVKLGFISYNDPEIPLRQNPSFSKGIRFEGLDFNLTSLIDELKDEQNVDVLFLVTHMGISKQKFLADHPDLKKVDYVLGNDTHERIRKPLQGKYAKVTEPGAFGSFVGKLDLIVKDGVVVNERYQLLEVDPEQYAPNPEVQKIIAKAREPYENQIEEVLGYSSTPLYRYFVVENPMDNMITDAARWKTGVDISISNGFRFSPPLVPASNGVAPITREYLWNMLPVNEKIKTGKATGLQIKNWLEQELHNVFAPNAMDRFGGWMVRFSGMTVMFNANAEKGKRVQEVLVGGSSIQDSKLYTMSACRREGEELNTLCRLPGVQDPEVMDYTIHEALADYLKYKGTVAPVKDGRSKALDLGDNVLSQLPGTNYHFH